MTDPQIANIYPLTAIQQGMLFHSISAPGSGIFIDQIHFDINLKTDQVSDFKKSWNSLVSRHEVLRTAFIWQKIEQPVQVVKSACELDWQMRDYSTLTPVDRESQFVALLLEDRHKDFDLNLPPLFRVQLVKLSESVFRVLWTFHHLILDGWSVSSLFSELSLIFDSLRNERRPSLAKPRPFSDFVEFSLAQSKRLDDEFWKNYLKGYRQPASFTPSVSSAAGIALAEEDIKFDTAENTKILDFTRKNRFSINTLVHAAWSLILMTYTGRDDVVYGATFSGRDPRLQGIEKMIGVFINTLPVRIARVPGQGIRAWLQGLQNNLNRLKDHELDSLTQIKRCSELDVQANLFDSLLVVENYPDHQLNGENGIPGIPTFTQVTHVEQSNYPCVLLMLPYSPLQFRIIYDANRFQKKLIRSMLEQLHHCLLSLCRLADATIDSIDILPASHTARLMNVSVDSQYRFEFETGVHNRIQSFSHCDDIAITGSYGDITYKELNRFSDMLAKRLSELAGTKLLAGQIVAIHLSRDQPVIECMLAVLKSGAAYVVIDPDYPKSRIDDLIRDSNPVVCITHTESGLPGDHQHLATLPIDRIVPSHDVTSVDVIEAGGSDGDSLAYLLYTSGSTGRPKGVKISHANLAYSTRVRSQFYSTDPSVYLLLSPFVFDSSVAGIYWTLTNGGRLVVSEPRLEQNLKKLIDQIHHYQVTHTLCLPGLYELILDYAGPAGIAWKLQSLKTVILAGEAITSPLLVQRHREFLPETRLFNEYGPTEATVWSSVYDVCQHQGNFPMPIGKAIPGTQILILDVANRLMPFDVPGEICIAGPGVSQGYFNQQAISERQFIELPAHYSPGNSQCRIFYKTGDLGSMNDNGVITFLGRRDEQIKIRGHRLEPGEIEQALLSNPQIGEAVAFSVATGTDSGRHDADHLSEAALEQQLAAALEGLPETSVRELIDECRQFPKDST